MKILDQQENDLSIKKIDSKIGKFLSIKKREKEQKEIDFQKSKIEKRLANIARIQTKKKEETIKKYDHFTKVIDGYKIYKKKNYLN